jgi:hypothetical protein
MKMLRLSTDSLIYLAVGMFSLSLGNQAWNTYKMSRLDETIKQQIAGNFTKNAEKIKELREDIRMAESHLTSVEELQKKSEERLKHFGDDFDRFRNDTNTQVNSLGVQISKLGVDIKKGSARRGGSKSKSKPAPPKPETWEGFKIEHISWCEQFPQSCDPFMFSWESEHKVKGSPIATFSSPNLWTDDFNLNLNLAFRVTAVNFREDPTEGIAQNQSIRVEAGFFDEETGEFTTLTETELFKDDPNLSPDFFYTPTVVVQPEPKIKLFEPFVYAGVGYAPEIETGLVGGASFLNLRKGSIRIGASALISSNGLGVGPQVSYHHRLLGKNLNIAPMGSALLRTDGAYSWGLGLLFQLW